MLDGFLKTKRNSLTVSHGLHGFSDEDAVFIPAQETKTHKQDSWTGVGAGEMDSHKVKDIYTKITTWEKKNNFY